MSLIYATHIQKTFINGSVETPVLKGIDFRVDAGEFVGIMGKSGAGKSTLLYQLSLLDYPTEGTVVVNDTDVLALSEKARTDFRLRTLGYVFQDYALVPELTAEENVLLPLLMRGKAYHAAEQIAHDVLNRVGMEHRFCNLPSALSGGEQQRVAVARAIAGTPRILFADEPTANLDSVSGNKIIEILTELNRTYDLTIVMVTHEREYARNCNRIVHLEDGCIVDEEHHT
jgi:putative ABC transport system ATP-binding protein